MTLRAGELRDKVVIQQKTQGTDSWGAPLPDAWEDYATIWANVRHLSGTESIKADAETSTVRASVRIRWRTDIDAGMRIAAGGAFYNVVAVLPDFKGRVFVDLVCERVD